MYVQTHTDSACTQKARVCACVCGVGTAAALGGGSDTVVPQDRDSVTVCVHVCVCWCCCKRSKCLTQYCECVHLCVCASVSVCMEALTPISLTQDSLNSTRGGLQQHKLQGWGGVMGGCWARDEVTPTTVLLWCCAEHTNTHAHNSPLLYCCCLGLYTADWHTINSLWV